MPQTSTVGIRTFCFKANVHGTNVRINVEKKGGKGRLNAES
jgi:hypothetical protein